MARLRVSETWAYRCRTHDVEAAAIFPVGYKGAQGLRCPEGDHFMEVTSRPEKPPDPNNVIPMYARRQAQLALETLTDSIESDES